MTGQGGLGYFVTRISPEKSWRWNSAGRMLACQSCHSMFTASCPLPCAHCPVSTALCLLLWVHCPVLTAFCSLPCVHCPVSTALCSLSCAHCPVLTNQHHIVLGMWCITINLAPRRQRRIKFRVITHYMVIQHGLCPSCMLFLWKWQLILVWHLSKLFWVFLVRDGLNYFLDFKFTEFPHLKSLKPRSLGGYSIHLCLRSRDMRSP